MDCYSLLNLFPACALSASNRNIVCTLQNNSGEKVFIHGPCVPLTQTKLSELDRTLFSWNVLVSILVHEWEAGFRVQFADIHFNTHQCQ